MLTSTRYQIPYPDPARTDTADVPRDIGSVVTAIEKSAMYGQGTAALRPVSTPASPGIQGRFYYATDTGVMNYDFGTGWISLLSSAAGSLVPATDATSDIGSASLRWRNFFGSGTIHTAGTFEADPAAVGNMIFQSLVAAEANPHFSVDGDGKHHWGPGGAAVTDTALYRSAAGVLKTDGGLFVGGSITNAIQVSANFIVDNTGKHLFSALNAGVYDANLYRSAAGVLITDGGLLLGTSVSGGAVKTTVSAWSGGPPGSPGDKDVWVATSVDANGTRWTFQYNAGSASAYKWEFIGGGRLLKAFASFAVSSAGWTKLASFTGMRPGEYGISAWAQANQGGTAGTSAINVSVDNGLSMVSSTAEGQATLAAGEIGDLYNELMGGTTTGELDVYGSSSNAATIDHGALMPVPRRIS